MTLRYTVPTRQEEAHTCGNSWYRQRLPLDIRRRSLRQPRHYTYPRSTALTRALTASAYAGQTGSAAGSGARCRERGTALALHMRTMPSKNCEGEVRRGAGGGAEAQQGYGKVVGAKPGSHSRAAWTAACAIYTSSGDIAQRGRGGGERHSAARLAARATAHPQAARMRASGDDATRIRQSIAADRPIELPVVRRAKTRERNEMARGLICALPQHDADGGIEAVARRRGKKALGRGRRTEPSSTNAHVGCDVLDQRRWGRMGRKNASAGGGRKELDDGLGRWDEVVVGRGRNIGGRNVQTDFYIPPPAERPVAQRQAAASPATVYVSLRALYIPSPSHDGDGAGVLPRDPVHALPLPRMRT
ncbi:hypothetical protein C8J57DRAFT_1222945 [Mycena rebaudengoi]|nr:hypothetical protein C8J57DRAFT_1222945 [Mycena rebaudengoi]